MIRIDQYRALIHCGTSTWTYPEWQEIIYHQAYTAKTLKTESLMEYAAFEPFSNVGIDNTFYAPPNPFVLEEYAKHLPAGPKCVSKVREELTEVDGACATHAKPSPQIPPPARAVAAATHWWKSRRELRRGECEYLADEKVVEGVVDRRNTLDNEKGQSHCVELACAICAPRKRRAAYPFFKLA